MIQSGNQTRYKEIPCYNEPIFQAQSKKLLHIDSLKQN